MKKTMVGPLYQMPCESMRDQAEGCAQVALADNGCTRVKWLLSNGSAKAAWGRAGIASTTPACISSV